MGGAAATDEPETRVEHDHTGAVARHLKIRGEGLLVVPGGELHDLGVSVGLHEDGAIVAGVADPLRIAVWR